MAGEGANERERKRRRGEEGKRNKLVVLHFETIRKK